MTNIEWTDETWNPVAGCFIVSPGCTNCYAMRMAARLEAMGLAKYAGLTHKVNGRAVWTGKINLSEPDLLIPLKRKKPTKWFVNSMSDLFHEGVPFEFVDRVFAVMALCPQHTFQILTKRPERMAAYLNDSRSVMGFKTDENVWKLAACMDGELFTQAYRPKLDSIGQWPLPNVWLGTSVEDQKRADERIPHLLRCPAAVRFISAEPLLGPVDIRWNCAYERRASASSPRDGLHWVIVGGESGPGARPCYVNWVDSLRDQCAAAGTAFFCKQLGANVRCDDEEYGDQPIRLKDSKGGDPAEWPADLRVRQFPHR